MKTKKFLTIPIRFVTLNVAPLIQKTLRDQLRLEFDKKNQATVHLKRQLQFILNQEGFTLRKTLAVNKNPDFCLITLRQGVFTENAFSINSPLFHPDLKDLLGCFSAGLLENTVLIMTGDRNEQLKSLGRNRIEFTATYKNADGKQEQKSFNHFDSVTVFLADNPLIYNIQIGKLIFQFFLNYNTEPGKKLFAHDDVRFLTAFVWYLNESRLIDNYKSSQKERNELIKLKKFALILPKGMSEVIQDELKKEDIRNVSCFDSPEVFSEKKDDSSLSKTIEYLERTKYKDLEIYLDFREKCEFFSVLLGNRVFAQLENLSPKIGLILQVISSKDRALLMEHMPPDMISELVLKNSPSAATKHTKLAPGEKAEIISSFLTVLENSDNLAAQLAKFGHSFVREIINLVRPLLLGFVIQNLPPEGRQSFFEETGLSVPSKTEFASLAESNKSEFILSIAKKKEAVEPFLKKHFEKLTEQEHFDRSIKELFTHTPHITESYFSASSLELIEEILRVFPETSTRVRQINHAAGQNTQTTNRFFEYVNANYHGIIRYLKRGEHTFAATSLLYTFAGNSNREHIPAFWDILRRQLSAEGETDRLRKLISFLKTPFGESIRRKLLENISYLSSTFDLFVCMPNQRERLEKQHSLSQAVCVEIPKDLEKDYLEILEHNNINLKNKDEVISFITRLIDEKIRTLQTLDKENILEFYLMETILLLLKLILCLLKRRVPADMFEKLDSRQTVKVKIKSALKTKYDEINLSILDAMERSKSLDEKIKSAGTKKDQLVRNYALIGSKLDELSSQKRELEVHQQKQYKMLSRLAMNQRTFAKAFSKHIRTLVFPDNTLTDESAGNLVFAFTPEQQEHITSKKICFITFSVKFISFIRFCVHNDKLPEDIFFIGNHLELPENAHYIFFGPDVDQNIVAKISEKRMEATFAKLPLSRYEEVLDRDERAKRKLRAEYLSKKGEIEALNKHILAVKSKEEEVDASLSRFDAYNYEVAEKLSEIDSAIKAKNAEKRWLERDIRVIFEEMDNIDAKFRETFAKVKETAGSNEDLNALGAKSLDQLDTLINELISMYGDLEFLMMIKRINDISAVLTKRIQEEIMKKIARFDRVSLNPKDVSNYVIFHDGHEKSITTASQVHQVLDILTSSLSAKVHLSRFKTNMSEFDVYGENAIFILVGNDERNNLRNLLSNTTIIPRNENTWNTLVITDYPPLGLNFGDRLKNETAMNVFGIMDRAILINLNVFKVKLEIKILNTLYISLNFDDRP